MATTATLGYQCTAVGPVSPSALQLAMASVVLPTNEFDFLGVTLISDTTNPPVGSDVTRVIVLALSPFFNASFPSGTDQTGLFQGIYKFILGNQLHSLIKEFPPVIA